MTYRKRKSSGEGGLCRWHEVTLHSLVFKNKLDKEFIIIKLRD